MARYQKLSPDKLSRFFSHILSLVFPLQKITHSQRRAFLPAAIASSAQSFNVKTDSFLFIIYPTI